MLYMFLATDAEGSGQARKEARPAHLARLKELQQQNRLVLAGPTPFLMNQAKFQAASLLQNLTI